MGVCRNVEEAEFVQIRNDMAGDPRLSFKAKGILTYLLSHPPRWDVQITDVINHGTEGRDAVYSAMRELRLCGYAKLVIVRRKGRIVQKRWDVMGKPFPDFPDKELERAGYIKTQAVRGRRHKTGAIFRIPEDNNRSGL